MENSGMASVFNQRFTELANAMEEKTLYKKWDLINAKTGIPPKSLRKYYVAPNDDMFTSNRVLMPKTETIKALADFFGVSLDYLSGESDIPNLNHDVILKAEKKRGLTSTILQGIEKIDTLPDKAIYIRALEYMMDDEAYKSDGERKPFHLLYLIGKYFTHLAFQQETAVSLETMRELQVILTRQNITPATLRDMLSKVTEGATERPANPSSKYLEEIVTELKAMRSNVDSVQAEIFKQIVLNYKDGIEGLESVEIKVTE